MNGTEYQHKLEDIFVRFPSVQKSGFAEAYKPGLAHMEAFDALLLGDVPEKAGSGLLF